MNYYAARQHLETKTWCFTYINNGEIYTASCCLDHDITGHATKEEAEKCFYDYEINNLYTSKMMSYEKCQVKKCGKLTNLSLSPKRSYSMTFLCKKHCNKKGYMQANPFAKGITIISS